MAEPKKRTLQGVYEGLKQISQDEGVDFGIDNYTYEQFRDKYKTPKDLLALYNNLSDISDESGLDFGIGSQNEWLGSFGDGWNEGGGQPRAVIQNADSYGLMPEAVEREKARKAGMYLPFATPEAAEEYRRERKTTAARKASTTEKPSVQNRWMPQTPYQSMEGAGGPAMPIEKLPGYQEEKAEYEKAMQKATSLMQTQRKVQKELSRGQVGELELSIDEQLAAAKKRDEDAAGLSDKSLWQKLVDPLKSGMGVEITTNQDILNNPEGRLEYGQDVRDLQAAKRMITDAKRMIAEADHNAKEGTYESSFIAGIGRGFRQKFSDVSTWDMGVTDITDNSAIFDALNAYEEGRLTPSQQTLLDAKVIELAVNEYFGSELGRGYKAGQVTAESLPFMIEMIANPIAGTGKGASKLMAKYALKRFAKKEMKKGASKLAAEETAKKLMVKDGKKYVSSQIMKGAARVGGDIAGATGMTATTGLGRTAADAIERMSGTPLWEIDDEGNTVMTGVKKGEDPATAWRKAFLNTTIENYSEMLGAYFAPITEGLGKGLQKLATSKGGSKIGLNKVGDFIENVKTKDLYKIVSDFEEHANWHGGIGEFGEEIAGGILNSLLVGDQSIRGKDGKIWNSSDPNALFNQDNLIDTGLGVGVLSVVFPFIKTVGYRSPRIQAKRELKEADDAGLKLWGGNQYEWGGIRNTLAFGNVEDVKNKIREVFSNPDVTEEQKKAVWDYAIKAQAYKGVENFEEKWDKDPESDPAQVAAVDTYEKAYEDITTPESRREQYIMYKDARERLNELVGDDMMARIDEAPLSINAAWQSSLDIDENMREALSRYIATKASVDGIEDRINDDADEYADQQREEAKKQSFNADGSERPVEMKDGNTVYLKEGNIAVTEDGTIDVENSDQMVTVYDPKQGKNVPISPEDIKSLGEVRSAEDVEAGIERSRAEMVQSQLDEAQNKITVGTTFQTKEGVEAQVVAINGDDII